MSFDCIERISRSGAVSVRSFDQVRYGTRIARFVSAALLCLWLDAAVAAEHPPASFSRFANSESPAVAGQSRTLLPDGRWLFIGGSTTETSAAMFAQMGERASR